MPGGHGRDPVECVVVGDGFVPAPELFRLLDAFEHDAGEKGYKDIKALYSYCRNSACSIGRILLHLFQVRDPKALKASDSLCTALQLTNFWQDFSRDLPRGRLTLPRKEAKRFGVPIRPSLIAPDGAFENLLKQLGKETRKL